MLPYHNSVFFIFVVGWIAFASRFTYGIGKEIGGTFQLFLMVFLIFPRVLLLNSVTLAHVLS